MITLGIDLSSSREGTAASIIDWNKSCAIAREPELRCDDPKLYTLIHQVEVIGIDAPFGWPKALVDAISGWTETSWSPETRKRLQFRATDLHIREALGIWPLSVSTDRIALPAMRANAIIMRHDVEDRSGDGKFFEVYPAATLKSWGLPFRGYKALDQNSRSVRLRILRGLRERLSFLDVSDAYASTSDALDALIASLTARLAFERKTVAPICDSAVSEGWIHIPREGSFPTTDEPKSI